MLGCEIWGGKEYSELIILCEGTLALSSINWKLVKQALVFSLLHNSKWINASWGAKFYNFIALVQAYCGGWGVAHITFQLCMLF